ncbi:MAG: hypothetical protein ICV73_28380 [Acetobacteraceae bacterium]|nr:hypothetical protein [Acetobacteraceae bacterium]
MRTGRAGHSAPCALAVENQGDSKGAAISALRPVLEHAAGKAFIAPMLSTGGVVQCKKSLFISLSSRYHMDRNK